PVRPLRYGWQRLGVGRGLLAHQLRRRPRGRLGLDSPRRLQQPCHSRRFLAGLSSRPTLGPPLLDVFPRSWPRSRLPCCADAKPLMARSSSLSAGSLRLPSQHVDPSPTFSTTFTAKHCRKSCSIKQPSAPSPPYPGSSLGAFLTAGWIGIASTRSIVSRYPCCTALSGRGYPCCTALSGRGYPCCAATGRGYPCCAATGRGYPCCAATGRGYPCSAATGRGGPGRRGRRAAPR